MGNVYALMLFVSKLTSCVVHLCGCCGSGSTQSWSQALCWALCPACALALKARKGFHPPDPQPSFSHHLPQSPAPSAPPVPEMKVGADRAGQEREEREGADSSSRFLSWRTRNKKKSLAPPPPAKKPAREPEEAIPLIVFSRTAPRVATTKAKYKTPPANHPVTSSQARPPPQSARRSQSAPKRSSHREEVEGVLARPPPGDLDASDIRQSYQDAARVLFRK